MQRRFQSRLIGRRAALRRIAAVALSAAAVPGRAERGADETTRIGTTAVILDDQVGFLDRWRTYLEPRLARRVRFVQRSSYREVTEALRRDELDFAWVGGYPYVAQKPVMRLLAMPLYHRRQS